MAELLEGVEKISREIREEADKTPNISEALAKELAKSEDWQVRASIAGNIHSPAWLIAKLSEDEDARVRMAVANNLGAPIDTLFKLADIKSAKTNEEVLVAITALVILGFMTDLANNDFPECMTNGKIDLEKTEAAFGLSMLEYAQENEDALKSIKVA